MKNFIQGLPGRLAWVMVGMGITSLVGVPFLGTVVTKMLRGLSGGLGIASDGLETLSEYIQYNDQESASTIIGHNLRDGATINKLYNREDGTVVVQYNTGQYRGHGDNLYALDPNQLYYPHPSDIADSGTEIFDIADVTDLA